MKKKFRFEINNKQIFFQKGINETMSLDQSTHSIFGFLNYLQIF